MFLLCVCDLIQYLETNLRIRKYYSYFTNDEVDLAKVIKPATEMLFNLGVDSQVITPLNTPIDST